VSEAFQVLGLDWHDHVISDPALLRPSEIMVSKGNPGKAFKCFGWQANFKMRDVIKMIVESELNRG